MTAYVGKWFAACMVVLMCSLVSTTTARSEQTPGPGACGCVAEDHRITMDPGLVVMVVVHCGPYCRRVRPIWVYVFICAHRVRVRAWCDRMGVTEVVPPPHSLGKEAHTHQWHDDIYACLRTRAIHARTSV